MPPAGQDAWERLGRLLADRRVQIGARYKNKNLFATEREINRRMLWQVETGARDTYRPDTIRAIEGAYMLVPGSLERTLAGGDLEPARSDSPRLAPVPDPAPPLDLATADDGLIEAMIAAWPEPERKRVLEGVWVLYTRSGRHPETRAAVMDALMAILHRGAPRLAAGDLPEQGRATS